jgi:ATP-binding cassette subfamily F protein uup
MARAPLLQLSDLALSFGGTPVFNGLGLALQGGDRIALVGRNGSGKSTLMKVMAGLVEPDRGLRATAPGTRVGYMEQDPDLAGFATLGDYASATLRPERTTASLWRPRGWASTLPAIPRPPVGGSGAVPPWRGSMAEAPDLLLLDEPTNHLDIAAIGWLEEQLRETQGAFVLISHDRAVLRNVTQAVLWIDRGEVRRQDRGFQDFEAWRDRVWEEEDTARHKLDQKIKVEAKWAVEGISARRKRNQGRVRALEGLRQERRDQIRRQGTAALAMDGGPTSGKRVIVARSLSKSFGSRTIVRDLDLTLQRGDRLALVGPNGAGKTTLVNLLLGRLAPDGGTVTHGTNLEVAVLDQSRAALDPEMTLWDALASDPELRSGRSDQVMVRGTPKHVVAYLKDFLFEEAQARAPLKSLSGGEKARLLLARIMAHPSNLLVLDEPTNDLDIETLDLLQEVLGDYEGTVILVSHDRDFLDRVATVTVAMEGDGRAIPYAGGWTDMMAQRSGRPLGIEAAPLALHPAAAAPGPVKAEVPRATARKPP